MMHILRPLWLLSSFNATNAPLCKLQHDMDLAMPHAAPQQLNVTSATSISRRAQKVHHTGDSRMLQLLPT